MLTGEDGKGSLASAGWGVNLIGAGCRRGVGDWKVSGWKVMAALITLLKVGFGLEEVIEAGLG